MTSGNLDGLIAWLGKLDTTGLRQELEKYQALRQWALRQAGLGYEEGSKVRVIDGYTVSRHNKDGSPNGWWPYRECLTGGALGTAARIDFSPHAMAWRTDFRLDREWSVSEVHGRTVRYWRGPAADTPEGYELPSSFDQEHYPDGRKHVFSMPAGNLRDAAMPAWSPV